MPWPSSAAVNFLLPLTFVAFLDSVPSHALQTTSECPSPLFRLQRHTTAASVNGSRHQQTNAFHFFALTQDCQFVLARPDQLTKLSSLRVDPHSRECHPSRVQLLWSLASGQPSLLLLQRRSSNEFCLLPVEMPSPLAVLGDDLFSYSLRTALARFAKCSRPHNSNRQQPFMAEPDLVFPDSLYSDIFYQLESSNKLDWNVQQLQLSLRGHLHAIDQLNVQPMANGAKSSSILLATDPQRRRLFAIPKHINHTSRVAWTCPFDLLFRPAQAKFHQFPLFPAKMEGLSSLHGSVVTGFSADRNVVVFTVERSGRTELYLTKLPPANKREPETRCLLRTSFGLKVGLVSDRTLKELAVKGPLPPMGELSSTSPATFASTRLKSTTLKPTTQKPRTSPMPRARATWMAPANRQTPKTTPIQYYWHRSTTKAITLSSTTSTKTPTTKSPKAGEETWNDDYTEEQEEEKEEAEDEQGGEEEGEDEKEEAEEILLPGDDETPTPAQMVDEESSTSQPEGQKASSAGAGINGAFLMFGWSLFWTLAPAWILADLLTKSSF